MRVSRHTKGQEADRPPGEPARLPQRWALILVVALGLGTGITLASNIVAGVTAGLAAVGLLHAIMD